MKFFKPIVRILLVLILLVGLVLAFVMMPEQKCEQITAVPHTENESLLLGQEDVLGILDNAGIEIVGEAKKSIDLGKIAEELKKNPYVKEVGFVQFAGSKLVIDYTLRNIVLNVFTSDGENYFVDDNGVLVPYTPRMQDCLMVVNGNITNNYKHGGKAQKNVREALEITKHINKDEFCKAQFRQIHINTSNEPELMSTIGGQAILLGDASNIDEKLDNLKTVYENGLPHKGYNTYAKLDARYKNRIIGTRNK